MELTILQGDKSEETTSLDPTYTMILQGDESTYTTILQGDKSEETTSPDPGCTILDLQDDESGETTSLDLESTILQNEEAGGTFTNTRRKLRGITTAFPLLIATVCLLILVTICKYTRKSTFIPTSRRPSVYIDNKNT